MKAKAYGLALLMMVLMALFSQPGYASASGATVILDGKTLDLPENGQVRIVDDRVLIPLRVVAEEMGFYVAWKPTGEIVLQQDPTTILLTVNQTTGYVNGNEVILPTAPMLASDITFVPLRFVSEQMGMYVNWNDTERAVYITTPQPAPGANAPEEAAPPESNELAVVTGIQFSDEKLTITTDGSVVPNIFTLTAPNRIVVDLPNARFTEEWAEGRTLDPQQSGSFDIPESEIGRSVRYALFSTDPSTVRVVVDLDRRASYTLTDNGDGLVTVELAKRNAVVVIDPGHGGSDPGAISITKRHEKQFNLELGLKVQSLLTQLPDVDVIMTREDDTSLSLAERARIANDADADLFVSIHGNSINPPANPSGTETYYTRSDSSALAALMHEHVVAATGLPDRKVRQASLHVTRETKMPAVLLEVGYLSHATDESLMYTESFQLRVAESIVAGIKAYLGL